ncbi:MAG: group II truncated hemoglobin [Deltaproteobacteria bacterium]|nr:group II truncated hemoglobin [Deltaproteobacteria bacterium]MBW2394972.1 group II truncated hemoglobin [Deltaproteobacteria bacterium]
MSQEEPRYGTDDTSFRAAGGEQGVRALIDAFYAEMDTLPEARGIRAMHPANLEISADKLTRFLCGWLGGPNLYAERYGRIVIPLAHRHLAIGPTERDTWLVCMKRALAAQPYPAEFKAYLLAQLSLPAERIRSACEDSP